MRLRYSYKHGAFAEAMGDLYRPVAEAGSAAITEAATGAKIEGRDAIDRAGFSKRWQNAFRAIVYPGRGKVSANAAALIYHKIPYAAIRRSPERFRKSIGPLTYVERQGKPPLLVAPAMLGPAQAKKARPQPSVRALRRGAAGFHGARGRPTVERMVPVFVGKRSVDIPKKFALLKIIDRWADRLADLYVKHLRVE